MEILLALLLISWLVSSVLYIPYIQLLYQWKFQRQNQITVDAFNKRTPIFDKFHGGKVGTPVGGGALIILVVSIFFPIVLGTMRYFGIPVTSVYPLASEITVLLFTFISFGVLGLIDDAKKTFPNLGDGFFGLRLRHKLFLQILLSLIVSYWLVMDLHIQIVNIPVLGVVNLGWFFLPLSTLVIVSFANALNITDGLDGLAGGLLVIALTAFWFISASILDTPLSTFIALWLGSLIAFLYFNVFPARIFMGDVGALSFGATFAVIGLILGKVPALIIIGFLFVIEVGSSLLQLLSKRIRGKRIMAAAPLHLYFQHIGWAEPKIVLRFWVLSIICAIFGLWLAILTKPI
jgi:phospho-N-acetylmuramoyl-pentapeptide-transferase